MILAPIDFSAISQRVVDVAADLAQAFRGYVVLLHVVRQTQSVLPSEAEAASLAELLGNRERAADGELGNYKHELQDRGIHAGLLSLVGNPAIDILEQTRILTPDYIVIGSRGHTAFHSLVAGSTARTVLKHATCPVIVVPHLGNKMSSSVRDLSVPQAVAAS